MESSSDFPPEQRLLLERMAETTAEITGNTEISDSWERLRKKVCASPEYKALLLEFVNDLRVFREMLREGGKMQLGTSTASLHAINELSTSNIGRSFLLRIREQLGHNSGLKRSREEAPPSAFQTPRAVLIRILPQFIDEIVKLSFIPSPDLIQEILSDLLKKEEYDLSCVPGGDIGFPQRIMQLFADYEDLFKDELAKDHPPLYSLVNISAIFASKPELLQLLPGIPEMVAIVLR